MNPGEPLTVRLSDDGHILHVPAWNFYRDRRRFVLAVAGRRGAKTETGAKKFLKKIWEEDWPVWSKFPYNPGVTRKRASMWWMRRARMHYMVGADTYDLLKEPMAYLFQFLPPELIDHWDAGAHRLWLRGDILIEFKTLHDPSKKVGSGFHGMWIEEAARVRSDAWGLYLFPALGDRRGWAILTTTPLGKDWTFQAIEVPARKGAPEYGVHTWKTTDNIRAPDVIELARIAKRDLPPEHYEREFEANRQAFIGQIYKAFKAHKHTYTTLPEGLRLARMLGGADWGSANPGCLLTAGVTASDRPHVYVQDEVYAASMLVEDFWAPEAVKLNQKRRFNDWVADPAEPDNLVRFRNAGIKVSKHRNFAGPPKGWDEHARSVMAGIRTFGALIHQGRFHVHESCVNLIEELENYVWDRTSAGIELDHPKPHQKDHAVTTARYIVTSALDGPVLRAVA